MNPILLARKIGIIRFLLFFVFEFISPMKRGNREGKYFSPNLSISVNWTEQETVNTL